MSHLRKVLFAVFVAAFVAASGLPVGATSSPPVVEEVKKADAGAYQTADPLWLDAAGSSRGLDIAFADQQGDVWLERRDPAGTPLGPPILVDQIESYEAQTFNGISVAVGNGYTLIAGVRESVFFGSFDDAFAGWIVAPNGFVSRINALPCPDTTQDDVVRYTAAWNGTRFLVAGNCRTEIDTIRVNLDGSFTNGPSISVAAGKVALASAGGGFLLAYDSTASTSDVKGQRFTGAGNLTGSALTIAGGTGAQARPALATSGSAYLAAWQRSASGSDISDRTVSATGALGAIKNVTTDAGDQREPTLGAGASGTWHLAWREDGAGTYRAEGTKVGTDGTPVTPGGRSLTADLPASYHAVVLAGALPAGEAEVFFSGNFARHLTADGVPGKTLTLPRAPVPPSCVEVAAGPTSFLAVWQEVRQAHNPNLFGQRYDRNGNRVGPIITISSATGDQFCPTAEWGGNEWLVTWSDARSGTKDIYGTTVSATGAVNPTGGFPISTAANVQQSQHVAFDGTNFVVVWNDLRNGNQDIYAARVTPARQVLDPSGIPVTTATGAQVKPQVAAAGGRSLVTWVSGVQLHRRILLTNGTFANADTRIGADLHGFRYGIAASPTSFALVVSTMNNPAPQTTRNSFVVINRTTGNVVRTLDANPDQVPWEGADITFDGTNFVFGSWSAGVQSREPGYVPLRTVSTNLLSVGPASYVGPYRDFQDLRISGSAGRALLVGTRRTVTSALVR
jgi:hypothetical protein